LKAIHKHIFQDVYPWAGQFRTTTLGKTEYLGHPARWFTPPHLLEHEAERIFDALRHANLLRGLASTEFASEAARLLGEINMLHPFREGNARSQRILLDAVARETEYGLHFDVISRERMVQASIEANNGNLGMMRRMFEEITDVTRIQPLRRAIAFLSSQHFDWNVTYIATTTPGQRYVGTLAGRDGEAFMMRSDDNHILIGRCSDIAPEIRIGERLSFRAGKSS